MGRGGMSANRGIAALCLAVAVAAATLSGLGVFLRGDGATTTVVSPRGETYEMVTTGIYANNPERLVAEGVGWDVFTLVVAAPLMVVAATAVARGSFRGRLAALGLCAYFFYQYFMYALAWAFGPLFLPFTGLFAAGLAGVVWLASTIELSSLPHRFSRGFPNRGMAVFSALIGLLLLGMWLGRIRAGLGGDLTGAMLLGQTTLVVQALDLGLVVPLAFLTAVTAWRARPIGYLLSVVMAVKGFSMSGAIALMVVAAWRVEGTLEIVPLAIFTAAAGICLVLGLRMLRDAAPEDTAPVRVGQGPGT